MHSHPWIITLCSIGNAPLRRSLKNWLIKVALHWISEKQQVRLEPHWKLPRTRYKGPITPQATPYPHLPATPLPFPTH